VFDTIPDNFRSYAGDGLLDGWQVQYFGQNNPKAGPSVDATGTGQTNLFKCVAGLVTPLLCVPAPLREIPFRYLG